MLGLAHESTLEQIESVRRALAKSLHPDVGGSVIEMQRINAAADEAARLVAARTQAAAAGVADQDPVPTAGAPAPPAQPAAPGRRGSLWWRFDHPSFTIEALPAEAFEALMVVSTWLGELIDDDPPYRLDVELAEPLRSWCRLELVPDAGATTVSLSVGTERMDPTHDAGEVPDLDTIRDAWINALNSLDWADLGDSPRPP